MNENVLHTNVSILDVLVHEHIRTRIFSGLNQILVLELNDEMAEQVVPATVVDLLQGQDGFRWKGHTRLDVREEPVSFPAGFQPFALVQCQPPAVITAIALHSEWKLVAFGTSHGFGVYDYQQKSNVFAR